MKIFIIYFLFLFFLINFTQSPINNDKHGHKKRAMGHTQPGGRVFDMSALNNEHFYGVLIFDFDNFDRKSIAIAEYVNKILHYPMK